MDQALADLIPVDVPPPIELPDFARRDAALAGPLPSSQTGFAQDAWGRASGKFLSVLLRRTHTPLPSRWAHIALRNALLTQIPAPTDVNAADWAAERAWLLLRMQNGARAVTISGSAGKAQFSTGRFNGDLPGYINQVVYELTGGRNQVAMAPPRQTTINGIPAMQSSKARS